jgi:hypothetical protein
MTRLSRLGAGKIRTHANFKLNHHTWCETIGDALLATDSTLTR